MKQIYADQEQDGMARMHAQNQEYFQALSRARLESDAAAQSQSRGLGGFKSISEMVRERVMKQSGGDPWVSS